MRKEVIIIDTEDYDIRKMDPEDIFESTINTIILSGKSYRISIIPTYEDVAYFHLLEENGDEDIKIKLYSPEYMESTSRKLTKEECDILNEKLHEKMDNEWLVHGDDPNWLYLIETFYHISGDFNRYPEKENWYTKEIPDYRKLYNEGE